MISGPSMDNSLRLKILGLPRPAKRVIVMAVDVIWRYLRLDRILLATWLFPAGV